MTNAKTFFRLFGDRRPIHAGHLLVAVGIYFLLDWASFLYPFRNFNITPWNPLAGLTLFILLHLGIRLAPVVYIARVIGDLTFRGSDIPLPILLLSDLTLIAGYTIAALWIGRVPGIVSATPSRRAIGLFLGLLVVTSLPTATAYVLVLKTGGLIGWSAFPEAVFRRFIGDMIGTATVLPPLLLVRGSRGADILRALKPRHLGQGLAVIFLVWVIFGFPLIDEFKFFYLLFLPIIWLALVDGYPGAAWGVLGTQVAMIVLVHILSEHSGASVTVLQVLMATLAMTGLLLGAVVDERRRAEALLRDSETRMQTIFRTIPDALLTVRENGSIDHANPAAIRMFSGTPRLVNGAVISDILPDLPWPPTLPVGQSETIARTGSDRDLPVEVSTGTEPRSHDPLTMVVARDISARRDMELRLAEKQAILSRVSRQTMSGELASVIAHEVNQPLTALMTYAKAGEMLVEAPATPPLLRETLGKIVQQARRAAEIIQRLRDLLGRGEISPAATSLSEAVRESIELMEADFRRAGIRVKTAVPDNLPEIHADRIHLQQVVQNLLRNALDALTQAKATGAEIAVSAERRGDDVTVRVVDNGPGIPEELRDRLFQPFSGNKPGGMGLGLSICRSIVEAHGGRLAYEPNPRGGAVFTFSLPIIPGR